jgi:hypothetical protein
MSIIAQKWSETGAASSVSHVTSGLLISTDVESTVLVRPASNPIVDRTLEDLPPIQRRNWDNRRRRYRSGLVERAGFEPA